MLLVCLGRASAGCVGAVCVLGSREDPASPLSTSGTRDASVPRLPVLTGGQLSATFTLRSPQPRTPHGRAMQVRRAVRRRLKLTWTSPSGSLRAGPGGPDRENHPGALSPAPLPFRPCCSLTAAGSRTRNAFASSAGLRPDAGGFACGQTEAGPAVRWARVSVPRPPSGAFGTVARGSLRGNL